MEAKVTDSGKQSIWRTPPNLPPLTFLQLVLHDHQEGDANHEEVEAKADLAELPHGPAAHLPHHVLVGRLPADGRGVPEDHQAADEEDQGDLRSKEQRDPSEMGGGGVRGPRWKHRSSWGVKCGSFTPR